VMGFINVDPTSEFMRVMEPVLKAKRALGVDNWLSPGLPGTAVSGLIESLAGVIEDSIDDPEINPFANRRYLAQTALGGYAANLMQPAFARRFKGLSETEIDRVLESFAFKNCHFRQDIMAVLSKFWRLPA